MAYQRSLPYKVAQIVSFYISQLTHYRLALFLRIFNGLFPFVTMFVWLKISENSPSLSVQDRSHIIPYFVGVFVIGQIISAPVVSSLDKDIRMGRLSNRLLLPLNPYYYYLANKLSYSAMSLPYVFVPLLAISLFTNILPEVNSVNTLLFVLSTSLAIWLHFSRQYATGLLSFWTDKSVSVDGMMESIQHLLSGSFIPLMLFSEQVRSLVLLTPFPYTIHAPVAMLFLPSSLEQKIYLLIGQCVWLGLFHGLIFLLWRSGLKRYAGNGI